MKNANTNASKKASAKKVRAIMAFVAADKTHSCNKAAQKFKVSPASVRAMVDGQTHTKITGLSAKEGRRGVNYVREHKEMFIKDLTATTPNVSTSKSENIMAKKPKKNESTAPNKSTGTVESTTRPAKPSTLIEMGIDLSDNVNAIKAEAAMVMSKLDTRKSELLAELETIDKKREEWAKFTAM